jgi:hypothetical protein
MADTLTPVPGNPTVPGTNALFRGDSLTSFNGTFQLVLQNIDGNLVLQINDDPNANPNAKMINGPIWNAGTQGNGGVAILQDDGNFVVYGNDVGNPADTFFSTGTFGRFPFTGYLIVQDDGNLVLYDGNQNAIWQSSTSAAQSPGSNVHA